MDAYLDKFRQGMQYVNVVQPVTKKDLTNDIQINDDYLKLKTVKFIPASGAATRMFKDLYIYLNEQRENEFVKRFFESLESFAFYEDIKGLHFDPQRLGDRVDIIHLILDEKLNYAKLPKALLKVHQYENGSKTPIDEHIEEAKQYLSQPVHLHFTISKEHEVLFNDYIKSYLSEGIIIDYSFQKDKTNTLAVDINNQPFQLLSGEYLFRPAGHGALIENLNDIDADMIFIKNIDNVCHQNHLQDTIHSKKQLASIGVKIKQEIDGLIKDLKNNDVDLEKINQFLINVLHINYQQTLTKEQALKFLNRPLRVCGMVQNTGEPGGGPFVVQHKDYQDLQIVEKSELNLNDSKTLDIFKQSMYFNPVDLVCFVKDYQGNKFNLLDFVNQNRYFITEKHYKANPIKVLEHPGLWNGAMDDWNTVFVEVPLTTFNPIKTVNDLLRVGHQKKVVE